MRVFTTLAACLLFACAGAHEAAALPPGGEFADVEIGYEARLPEVPGEKFFEALSIILDDEVGAFTFSSEYEAYHWQPEIEDPAAEPETTIEIIEDSDERLVIRICGEGGCITITRDRKTEKVRIKIDGEDEDHTFKIVCDKYGVCRAYYVMLLAEPKICTITPNDDGTTTIKCKFDPPGPNNAIDIEITVRINEDGQICVKNKENGEEKCFDPGDVPPEFLPLRPRPSRNASPDPGRGERRTLAVSSIIRVGAATRRAAAWA